MVGAVSTRRKGTVKLIFMSILAPCQVQRNGSSRSVVADLLHQRANEQTRILLKGLPQGFWNIQLLACRVFALTPIEADRGRSLRSCARAPIWWDKHSLIQMVWSEN
jgi:hypothetical protein